MKRALIQPVRCANCTPCPVETQCPMKAVIREGAEEKPWIDFYQCGGCLKCKAICPHQAIEEIVSPCTGMGRRSW